MWVLADVVGLFSINVGPLSRNVGRGQRIFSANVVPNRPMLSGRTVYVLRPLQVADAGQRQEGSIAAVLNRFGLGHFGVENGRV
jgi:hypothetical protein